MIDVSLITKQIQQWLRDDEDLDGYTVERSEPLNEDPGLAANGWICIYRREAEYEPKNLGHPTDNYAGELDFDVVVQKISLQSGSDAEDALEEAVLAVFERMISIPKTYIDQITGLTVVYGYVESDRTTMYFQTAVMTFTAEFHQ